MEKIDMDILQSFVGSEELPLYTDKYFTKTKEIVEKFGDSIVTYAVFMRRPVVYALDIAIEWLRLVAKEKNQTIEIKENYQRGDWVGAGEPLFFYTGSFKELVEIETLLLQKVGACCVAAYNAREMCLALPNVAFLAMDARHCTGKDMMHLMAYGASVGSESAKRETNAKGFIGSANDVTACYFPNKKGMGTMPHALIGMAGSTAKAAKMYHETFPDENLTVLNDYFGKEVSDSIEVCKIFPELAKEGKLAFRSDTHGGRFIEGLDRAKSYAVLERHAPEAIKDFREERELKHLVGTGVSAAAIWHLREQLDNAGYPNVKIVASSGFTAEKCKLFAIAKVPVDVIGTGSYLPENWLDTYTTADIIAYGNEKRVKIGREFLFKKF